MLTDLSVPWQVDEEEKLLVQRHEDGSELRWHILRMVWALCGDSEKGAVDGVGDPKGVKNSLVSSNPQLLCSQIHLHVVFLATASVKDENPFAGWGCGSDVGNVNFWW